MHLTGSFQSPRFRPPRPPDNGPRAPGLALVAILVGALVVFVLVLPCSVVLPVFSLWALSAVACAALLAIFPLRVGTSFAGAWDMAGASTPVGCAAILGEIGPIIELRRPSGHPEQSE